MLCLFNNLFFYLYRIQLYSYLYLTNNEQYFNISRRFLYTIAYSYSPGTHSQSSARVRSPLTVCAVAQYSFCSILARHSARVRSPLAVWLSPDTSKQKTPFGSKLPMTLFICPCLARS